MYNKVKHLTGYIAAIGMLALGALLLVYEVYAMGDILLAARDPFDHLAVLKAFINVLFFSRFPIRLVLGIVCILFGLKNIRKPISHEYLGGKIIWDYVPLKQSVIFFIVCGVLLFLGCYDLKTAFGGKVLLNANYYSMNTFFMIMQWFQVIVTLILLALKIVSLCLRNSVTQTPEDSLVEEDAVIE